MVWHPNGKVNLEDGVLPVRTVVLIFFGILGMMGLLWSARGQWDDTQSAIKGTQTSIDKLGTEQEKFRSYIANLIVEKGNERDNQFKQVNSSISDLGNNLTTSVADLNAKIAQLKAATDGTHGETAAAIMGIQHQIDSILKDIAAMKCKLSGFECTKAKP